jgi:hypothetical protein
VRKTSMEGLEKRVGINATNECQLVPFCHATAKPEARYSKGNP